MGGVAAAATTITRLQQLDIALALPGHGPLITDVPASLERIAAMLAQFRADPEKLYRHLVRRVFIATLLARQPVSRSALLDWMLALPWTTDYLPTSGYPRRGRATLRSLVDFHPAGRHRRRDGQQLCYCTEVSPSFDL